MPASLENFGVHKGITVYKSDNNNVSIFMENFNALPPSDGIGKDGDRAIDLSTICIYEKIAGTWVGLGCLGGEPQGPSNPTLTNPSLTFTISHPGLREIGEILDLVFNSTFNRGSIDPQYTADSPFRSGLPNEYAYTGDGLPPTTLTDVMTLSHNVPNWEVPLGVYPWTNTIFYDGGVQPKNSVGADFDTPLPPGSVNGTVSITGVYPWFATSQSILSVTKQPLMLMNSEFAQVTMVAENDFGDKQTAEFPDVWQNIIGVRFYNFITQTWDWVAGSPANSLTRFDMIPIVKNINGYNVDYIQFRSNSPKTGERQLRFQTV